MRHPLNGCFLRIARAERHIREELVSLLDEFRESNEDKIITQKQVEAWKLRKTPELMIERILEKRDSIDIPLIASIITGETIYNLRSALDCLIYELARHDSGGERPGTQFLIESKKLCSCKRCLTEGPQHGFDGRKGKCLNGLSHAHVDEIENFQPYKGIKWTETLRDLSNPDKHRKLTIIAGDWSSKGTVGVCAPGTFDNRADVEVLPSTEGPDVYMDLQHSLNVTLPDGSPLVEVLLDLLEDTRKAVQLFASEF